MPVIHCPVKSIKHLNHDTRQIILDTVNGLEFKAGQYLEVIANEKRYPFSIASAPSYSPLIELHVRPTPNSVDSDEFEALLDSATEVSINAPLGDCYIEAAGETPLILIAAATGVTQMKSIIEHLLKVGLNQPTYLYWGVLSDKDLYLTDTCAQWQSQNSDFHFIPVVSEPSTSPNWQGRTGLVGNVTLEDFEDLSNISVVVGGSPGMVYATLDMFIAKGMPEQNMTSDVFSYAPRK